METVGSETEAYAIADTMAYCKSDMYTVNCGMAYGQAAMLLSQGAKGFRAEQPNSSSMIQLHFNYDEMLAQSNAMRGAGGGPQAAPSVFR